MEYYYCVTYHAKYNGNLINILGADHLGYLKRIESAVKALSSNKNDVKPMTSIGIETTVKVQPMR